MSKKILVLEPHLDLLGGSERMAFEVAKGLAKKGWEIHVGFEREGVWRKRYEKFVRGFHPVALPIGNFRRPFELAGAWRRLHRLVRGLGIEAIFTSHPGQLLTAAVLEKVSGLRSCFHLGLMGSVANTVSGRWAVRQISAGVAPAEQTARSWREIGWPKEALQVVPNWIDWEDYSKLPTKEEARATLGILDIGYVISDQNRNAKSRKEVKVVGYVGRLVKEKGIEVLLEAWRGMEEKLPEAVLIIAGSGVPEYEMDLKKRAGTRVCFLGAVTDPKTVYAACDLVVVPSLVEEAFGLIPLEAVACGALPLVSDRGFLPKLLQEEAAELVYQAGREDELFRQMTLWLSRERTVVTSRLRHSFKEKFSAAKGVQAYQEILESFFTA